MNKKKLLQHFMIMPILALFSSCVLYVDGTVGEGRIVETSYNVSSFNAIENASSAEVTVSKGDSLKVILSDYENLIELWDVKVVNNKLLIQTKPFTSIVNSKVKVTVILPTELYNVKISGSGDVKLTSPFQGLNSGEVSGSGAINSDVTTNYDKLNLKISGSGSFSLTGHVNELKAITTGSGKMFLAGLVAKSAECTISGSGNMYVNAQESLKATIIGSGDIIYSSNPIIDIQASGSGSLRHN